MSGLRQAFQDKQFLNLNLVVGTWQKCLQTGRGSNEKYPNHEVVLDCFPRCELVFVLRGLLRRWFAARAPTDAADIY